MALEMLSGPEATLDLKIFAMTFPTSEGVQDTSDRWSSVVSAGRSKGGGLREKQEAK